MSARTDQLVTEILTVGASVPRAEQLVTEVFTVGESVPRVGQLVVEVVYAAQLSTSVPTRWFGYLGLAPVTSTSVPVGKASIAWTGQVPVSVVTPVQVSRPGYGVVTYVGLPVATFLYEADAAARRHVPCGHWHTGQSDNPVWSFVPQPNLPIPYHKHPVAPRVCGHWHKPLRQCVPCIDYIEETTVPYVEGHGLYSSSEAFVRLSDGTIIGGDHASGTFFTLGTGTFGITGAVTVSGVSGVEQIEEVAPGIVCALVRRTGYVGKWLQLLTAPDFVPIQEPLYCGLVVTGTDGKRYGALYNMNLNVVWREFWRPVSGPLWASGWEEITEPYSYRTYASLEAYLLVAGVDAGFGANVVNFKLTDGGYLLNCGPTSAFLQYTAFPVQISPIGEILDLYTPSTTIGPHEMMELDGSFRLLHCTSAFGNQQLRDVLGRTDVAVTGLTPNTGVYQEEMRWNAGNNLLYVLGQDYPDTSRIYALDPNSGAMVYEYTLGLGNLSFSSFIIVGDFVYLWQNIITDSTAVTSIFKFTLGLEVVCIVPCEGAKSILDPTYSLELGGQLTSDGTYIYNWNNGDSGNGGGTVTRYRIAFDPTIDTDHDPRWPFEKQSNIW